MRARWISIAVGVASLAVFQAVVETLVTAWLHRGVLLAPYRFFTLQSYDAFTKLYFAAYEQVNLPAVLDRFVPLGMWPKLALTPEFVAVNLFVAVPVAVILFALSSVLGMGASVDASRRTRRAILWTAVFELVVHTWVWANAVKIPMEPTVAKVARNFAKSAVYDGYVLAVATLLVALVGALMLARAGAKPMIAGAAAAVLAVALARPVEVPANTPNSQPASAPPAAGYNVVMVSIDSLRADHLSAYGYERQTSPAIDALARRGVLFEHCQSTTSWTLPAHLSMLTGRSLLGHGVVGDDRALGEDVPTLAGAFSEAGYRTGAVVSAPYVNSRYGFARGFDDYDDRTVHFETNEDSYKSVTAPLVNSAAESWIDAGDERPFFLFLHYWDAHYDYAPGPPYDTMFDPDYQGSMTGDDFYFSPDVHAGMAKRDLEHILALYDGEIRLVDDHIGKLVAFLQRRGLAERTIVVVTSDHGDEFFEHGRKGHHRTLYEEVLHVPLVIAVPGLGSSGRRVRDHASIIDIMPSVLALTGVEIPDGVEGRNLFPEALGQAAHGVPEAFAELYRKGSLNVQVSVTREGGKLIHHFNRRALESYELGSDPGEQQNLGLAGERTAALAGRLRSWLTSEWQIFDSRVRAGGVAPVEIDAATEDMLRSLGYVE